MGSIPQTTPLDTQTAQIVTDPTTQNPPQTQIRQNPTSSDNTDSTLYEAQMPVAPIPVNVPFNLGTSALAAGEAVEITATTAELEALLATDLLATEGLTATSIGFSGGLIVGVAGVIYFVREGSEANRILDEINNPNLYDPRPNFTLAQAAILDLAGLSDPRIETSYNDAHAFFRLWGGDLSLLPTLVAADFQTLAIRLGLNFFTPDQPRKIEQIFDEPNPVQPSETSLTEPSLIDLSSQQAQSEDFLSELISELERGDFEFTYTDSELFKDLVFQVARNYFNEGDSQLLASFFTALAFDEPTLISNFNQSLIASAEEQQSQGSSWVLDLIEGVIRTAQGEYGLDDIFAIENIPPSLLNLIYGLLSMLPSPLKETIHTALDEGLSQRQRFFEIAFVVYFSRQRSNNPPTLTPLSREQVNNNYVGPYPQTTYSINITENGSISLTVDTTLDSVNENSTQSSYTVEIPFGPTMFAQLKSEIIRLTFEGWGDITSQNNNFITASNSWNITENLYDAVGNQGTRAVIRSDSRLLNEFIADLFRLHFSQHNPTLGRPINGNDIHLIF